MTRFNLAIMFREDAVEKDRWAVILGHEGQHNAFVRPSLKLALKEAETRMNRRIKFARKFPLSAVLAPNGSRQRVTSDQCQVTSRKNGR